MIAPINAILRIWIDCSEAENQNLKLQLLM
jgi:hypothetical protein